MKKGNRKGFTLIELMVVAVIVAILAALAIPLMSGNRKKAVATEGQTGCSAINASVRVYRAQNGTLPASGLSNVTELLQPIWMDRTSAAPLSAVTRTSIAPPTTISKRRRTRPRTRRSRERSG